MNFIRQLCRMAVSPMLTIPVTPINAIPGWISINRRCSGMKTFKCSGGFDMVMVRNNFNAGEISPLLRYRADLEKYAYGCSKLENFTVLPWGGVENRPGTEFIAECKHHDKDTCLIPFEFNIEQTYIIEAGDHYFRFYMNGGQILDDEDLIYELETPYAHTDVFKIRYAQSADVLYLAHPEYPPHTLTRRGHSSWELTELSVKGGPFMDENKEDIDLTPSATSGNGISVTASADFFTESMTGMLLKITHPRENNYISHDFSDDETDEQTLPIKGTWKIETSGTWEGTLHLDRSFNNGSSWNNYRNWHAAADRNIEDEGFEERENTIYRLRFSGWQPPPDGSIYKCSTSLSCEDYWINGIVRITAVNSAVQITADVVEQLGDVSATSDWALSSWNSNNGYPAMVNFYQDRLIFARTRNQPQTLWLSASGDYGDFTAGTDADQAMLFTIKESSVNAINWIMPMRQLAVGTKVAEGMFKPTDENEPLTPENRKYDTESYNGSADLPAVRVSNVVLFIQRQGEYVRELAYSFEEDGYIAPNMTLLSEHVLRGGVKQSAFQQLPYPVVWYLRNDGVIAGFTYERKENVTAWHRHITDGKFHAVAVIADETHDELWTVVERHGKRFVERFAPREFTSAVDSHFLDCALGSEFPEELDEVSGMDHLEGFTVSAVVDGSVQESLSVVNGTVKLPRPGKSILVGLPYTSTLETMPLEMMAEQGSTLGATKRISHVALKFYKTLGGKVAVNDGAAKPLISRTCSSPMDQVPDVKIGETGLHVNGSLDSEQVVKVVQDQPYPMSLLCLVVNIAVKGEKQ
eukprot:TRINITY_DN6177_c0_g2_i4.p1 TRINITY_DN6177_c0_g2~~TRINITY_DN6177_c0_g2_i4.p1  ORF type:complete len:808 (-),score=202.79 TRINITY_DN6177_c0_g2_i4:2226-4649(-)